MNAAQVLDHFDRMSDAPDAIPRLRRFILDLAVRGKLVEQDPNDEPASKMLKRIETQKTRLVTEGKIKAQDPQPVMADDEMDFALPANWERTRIGDLLTVIRGASPRPKGDPKYFSTERTPYHWIKISDIRKHSKDRILLDTDEFLTEAGMEKSVLLPRGTLVVTNSATIGVPIFLGFDGGCIHDGYLAFPYFPDSELSKDFFFILFQTLQSYATKKARGMAQLNLNTGLVREFPLGLPPFAEQHRIVTKVNELMALCDRLEAAKAERESRRDKLTAASLHRLNNGADADEFREHARFHLRHLPHLTTRPEHIQQLRQTILNLAVRGKLVPQDSNDEPASELIKRITAEKHKLIKQKEFKNQQDIGTVVDGDAPFQLPSSWNWEYAGSLFLNVTDGFHNTPAPTNEGFRYITAKHIRPGKIDFDKGFYVDDRNHRELFAKTRVKRGDILIVNIGAGSGTPAIVDVDFEFSFKNIAIFNLPKELYPKFIFFYLLHYRSVVFEELIKGAAQPFLGLNMLRRMLVPVPPLAEQHRIVSKIDELMALCDGLDAQLTMTRTESRRLLEAVLKEALHPT
jgi:type I restriction enzyme S subunit